MVESKLFLTDTQPGKETREPDDAEKYLIRLFIYGSWELMLKAIKAMPQIKQIYWKKALLEETTESRPLKDNVSRAWTLLKTPVEDVLQQVVDMKIEKNKGHVKRPYKDIHAQVEIIPMTAFVLQAMGVNYERYKRAANKAYQGLQSELPFNKGADERLLPFNKGADERSGGGKQLTIGDLPRFEMVEAVRWLAECSRIAGINLDMIPEDWEDTFTDRYGRDRGIEVNGRSFLSDMWTEKRRRW